MAIFNPDDPLNCGDTVPPTSPPTPNWGNNDQRETGGIGDGHAIVAGEINISIPNDYEGFPGTPTIVIVGAPFSPAVAVMNQQPPVDPSAPPASGLGTESSRLVGVFGRASPSHPTPEPTRNMGVLGLSDVGGVGVYGITGSVLVPPSTVNLGIGVVGRALDGVALEENESMEEILGVPPGVDPQGSVGVFGTSNSGVGVRAHAGPL